MAVTQTARACDSVIFGAKGDLARRKLLAFPVSTGKKPVSSTDTRIIGVGAC